MSEEFRPETTTHEDPERDSGEHHPCRRCPAASAGIAAERKSGYRAM